MLTVKQVDADNPHQLTYECYNNGERVGRLVGRPDGKGGLEAVLEEVVQREAGRTLVAKLEHDAHAHGLPGLFLLARDEREREAFLSNGYEPLEPDGLRLYKSLSLTQ